MIVSAFLSHIRSPLFFNLFVHYLTITVFNSDSLIIQMKVSWSAVDDFRVCCNIAGASEARNIHHPQT
jgi:hypothetical protein